MAEAEPAGREPGAPVGAELPEGPSVPEGPGLPEGPTPKHVLLTALLADHIARGLSPGAPIPSERALRDRYRVSRETVRKAIDALVHRGLVSRTPGKGTFVATPPVVSRLHLASFTADMRRRGLVPTSAILAADARTPPPDVRAALELGEDKAAWRIERLRLADGEPMALEIGWYPIAACPDLDRHPLDGSLYELLALAYGLVIDEAEQDVSAQPADDATARLLGVPRRSPLLTFARRSRAAGRPVEAVVSHYRSDRYRLTMTLTEAAPRNPKRP